MSFFRKDPVSGDWVIIAPERGAGKRPHDLGPAKRPKPSPKAKCPFEDLEATGNWPPILEYDEKGRWQVVVLPNKFPALVHGNACPAIESNGPYAEVGGIGHHELLITRDHNKSFPRLSREHAFRVFQFFAERYRTIDRDRCMSYLSVFGNWGAGAGASLSHPHYQLLALPVIPPDVARSLEGSAGYFQKNRRCAHCDVIAFERKKKDRIVFESDDVIAIAPYASKTPYSVTIYPKKHEAFFERSSERVLLSAAAMLQDVLARMEERLNGPDNNFFIHTGPLRDQKRHESYHWHIEIVPKVATPAGFELATGIYINPVDPSSAAKFLRKK